VNPYFRSKCTVLGWGREGKRGGGEGCRYIARVRCSTGPFAHICQNSLTHFDRGTAAYGPLAIFGFCFLQEEAHRNLDHRLRPHTSPQTEANKEGNEKARFNLGSNSKSPTSHLDLTQLHGVEPQPTCYTPALGAWYPLMVICQSFCSLLPSIGTCSATETDRVGITNIHSCSNPFAILLRRPSPPIRCVHLLLRAIDFRLAFAIFLQAQPCQFKGKA
jgi:hypothetical protein